MGFGGGGLGRARFCGLLVFAVSVLSTVTGPGAEGSSWSDSARKEM